MSAAHFSEQGYRELVESLRELDYSIVGFDEVDPQSRHLVLRHDIDMSLELAVGMAEIEASIDARAHYFILVSSEFYNVFAEKSVEQLSGIRDAGHAVGLHFDAALYDENEIDGVALKEAAALESLLDSTVDMVSLHRPANYLLGEARTIGGRSHTYQPRFFSEIGYCSDSRGKWGHGHPLEHEAVRSGKALQLLTHPVWWIGEAGPPTQRLHRFLDRRAGLLDEELAAQCDIHDAGRMRVRFEGDC